MTLREFSSFLERINTKPRHVLDVAIPRTKYIPIDLSVTNTALNNVDVASSSALSKYINTYLKLHDADVAYGGYLEQRNIYQRSQHFNKQAKEARDIHLAIDLWCAAETPIYAPLDGIVHSFKNNTNYGDYGPTIILEHFIADVTFYTLYGHLSLASIQNLKIGQEFSIGAQIATLGDAIVNGDYPPHLHFQIIKDLQGNYGDYPGVCTTQDLEFFSQNCPNPEVLLF
ncbi:hypothetical protein MHTCC0001_12580 [Flavobacteriaceae bacterium MHTCC 0001]